MITLPQIIGSKREQDYKNPSEELPSHVSALEHFRGM